MAPGERRALSFDTLLRERGFRTSRAQDARPHRAWSPTGPSSIRRRFAPIIGMNRDHLLDRSRQARGATACRPNCISPPPGDPASRERSFLGFSGRPTTDITVATDADQTPIAPGDVVSDRSAAAGAPRASSTADADPAFLLGAVGPLRAARAQRTRASTWRSTSIRSTRRTSSACCAPCAAALDYYQRQLRPLSVPPRADRRVSRLRPVRPVVRRHLSLVGGAGLHRRLRATRPGSTWSPMSPPMNSPTSGGAHQLVPADQQGATRWSETLAQYSALRVMRRLEGPDRMRKFLKFELDSLSEATGAARRWPNSRSSASRTSLTSTIARARW